LAEQGEAVMRKEETPKKPKVFPPIEPSAKRRGKNEIVPYTIRGAKEFTGGIRQWKKRSFFIVGLKGR